MFNENVSGESDPRADIISSGDVFFGLSEDDHKAEAKEAAARPRLLLGEPIAPDLWEIRSAPPQLTRERETALILAAQHGDARAGDELVRAHLPWLQWMTRRRWRELNPPQIEGTRHPRLERAMTERESLGTVLAAFWRTILRFDPATGNGLNAFARKAVMGALADAAHEWRNTGGLKQDSRIQRFIRAHPDASAKQVGSKFPSLSLAEIEYEQFLALPFDPVRYSETAFAGDGGEYDENGIGDGFKGGATEFDPELLRNSGMSQWTCDAARQQPSPPLSITVALRSMGLRHNKWWADDVEQDTNRRALARSLRDGVRAYTDWFCNRQSTCSPIFTSGPSLLVPALPAAPHLPQQIDLDVRKEAWRDIERDRLAAVKAGIERQRAARGVPPSIIAPITPSLRWARSATRLVRRLTRLPGPAQTEPAAYSFLNVARPLREILRRRSFNLQPKPEPEFTPSLAATVTDTGDDGFKLAA